jgi:hypothetical protein
VTWSETAAIFAAIGAVLSVIITSMLTVGKIGRMAGIMETTLLNQNERISSIGAKLEKLTDALTQIAVQSNRLDNHGQQITVMQRDIADLRRGEGFIVPRGSHPSGG